MYIRMYVCTYAEAWPFRTSFEDGNVLRTLRDNKIFYFSIKFSKIDNINSLNSDTKNLLLYTRHVDVFFLSIGRISDRNLQSSSLLRYRTWIFDGYRKSTIKGGARPLYTCAHKLPQIAGRRNTGTYLAFVFVFSTLLLLLLSSLPVRFWSDNLYRFDWIWRFKTMVVLSFYVVISMRFPWFCLAG